MEVRRRRHDTGERYCRAGGDRRRAVRHASRPSSSRRSSAPQRSHKVERAYHDLQQAARERDEEHVKRETATGADPLDGDLDELDDALTVDHFSGRRKRERGMVGGGVGTASCESGGGTVEIFDLVEEIDRLGCP